MRRARLAALAAALIGVVALGGCGESQTDERGSRAVGLCRDHGGVIALEDEIVICRDQTWHDDQ